MANFNFNKVILGGRLVSDPELKQTSQGIPLATFRMAVNRRYVSRQSEDPNQQTADFFTVTAWRQNAEFVSNYFRKSSSICVIGSIQMRQYTDQQGQKKSFTDIVADEIFFVDSKGEGPAITPLSGGYQADGFGGGNPSYVNNPPAQNQNYGSAPAAPSSGFEVVKDADDLPF